MGWREPGTCCLLRLWHFQTSARAIIINTRAHPLTPPAIAGILRLGELVDAWFEDVESAVPEGEKFWITVGLRSLDAE